MKEQLKERFLRYVGFDTRSDGRSTTTPSTPGQTIFLKYLAGELWELGLAEVRLNEGGYLTATVPATPRHMGRETIGLIAHVDTSPDEPGAGVLPHIVERYEGGDIALPGGGVIGAADFPETGELLGHTIITSDGTTLLGADDKAGVAAIVTAAEYLVVHPELEHGRIRLAFTPDEEIGRGADNFDVAAFGAAYAYTVDGGAEGELEYENFNAARAVITFRGANIHPGQAKGRMVNALLVAGEFMTALPAGERPENTSGYEGFFHVTSLAGDVGSAEMECLVRDHSAEGFARRKELLERVTAEINRRYGRRAAMGRAGSSAEGESGSVGVREAGREVVALRIEEQYRNMKEVLEAHPQVVERAREAMVMAGVVPVIKPIRGGTDGARLSFMGLPCPNIFTGGGNFHSRYEYVSLDSMAKAVEVILNICTI